MVRKGDEMKYRPLSFIGEMVRATQGRRKAQTRRPIRGIDNNRPIMLTDGKVHQLTSVSFTSASKGQFFQSPFGAPGDRLWIRERARLIEYDEESEHVRFLYEADGAESDWLPYPRRLAALQIGHCVPNGCYREASRITLEVKRVWCERLQDISEEDALAEGVFGDECMRPRGPFVADQPTAGMCFANLWDSCYGGGEYAWEKNPQVFACAFEMVEDVTGAMGLPNSPARLPECIEGENSADE